MFPDIIRIGNNKAQAEYAYKFYKCQVPKSPLLESAFKLLNSMLDDEPIPQKLVKIFFEIASLPEVIQDNSIVRGWPDGLYIHAPIVGFTKDNLLFYYSENYCTWTTMPSSSNIQYTRLAYDLEETHCYDQDMKILPSNDPNVFISHDNCNLYWNGNVFHITSGVQNMVFQGRWMATYNGKYIVTYPEKSTKYKDRCMEFNLDAEIVIDNYVICCIYFTESINSTYRIAKIDNFTGNKVCCTYIKGKLYFEDEKTFLVKTIKLIVATDNIFLVNMHNYKNTTGKQITEIYIYSDFIIANCTILYAISLNSGTHTKAILSP